VILKGVFKMLLSTKATVVLGAVTDKSLSPLRGGDGDNALWKNQMAEELPKIKDESFTAKNEETLRCT
jgi:hypothetical protein